MSDEDALIVARGTEVFCILNLYPYNPGHMMVLPYRKVASYEDLTDSGDPGTGGLHEEGHPCPAYWYLTRTR
jgi:hypothetical protein